jgi:hypothetical protein
MPEPDQRRPKYHGAIRAVLQTFKSVWALIALAFILFSSAGWTIIQLWQAKDFVWNFADSHPDTMHLLSNSVLPAIVLFGFTFLCFLVVAAVHRLSHTASMPQSLHAQDVPQRSTLTTTFRPELSLPPGFRISRQENRSGSNPLAPHVLWFELEIPSSIRGHLLRFVCNGPVYREACRFQQSGIDVGIAEAGPDTKSVVLRVGGRGFAEPGILTVELASIAPLEVRSIEDKPSFESQPTPSTRGGNAETMAPIPGNRIPPAPANRDLSTEQRRISAIIPTLPPNYRQLLKDLMQKGAQQVEELDMHLMITLRQSGLIEVIGKGIMGRVVIDLDPDAKDAIVDYFAKEKKS